ncbi:WAP four-disulfide core domain protein 2-like [Ptychodera flava]|uniref:WAP four-disulfide core domain protein 2-like n=1 Tax=Ptychodera flava TaxID=63121 RepID=UPI00396A0BB1
MKVFYIAVILVCCCLLQLVSAGPCHGRRESYRERYRVRCGWFGWGRCVRYRTAYRLRPVNCIPDMEKPGQCPSTAGRIGLCAEMCRSDGDCAGNQKCCSNGCGHSCAPPLDADVQKPGQCPSAAGSIGICVERCHSDGDCPGDQKCCSNGCGHTCVQP